MDPICDRIFLYKLEIKCFSTYTIIMYICTYDNAGKRLIKQSPDSTALYLRHGRIAVDMDVEINTDQTEVKWKINR